VPPRDRTPPAGAFGRRLAAARSIAVLTGAGVSAESGIPTFRDALTGLWARYDPTALASPDAFDRDPALVTRWYDERRTACLACTPNPGHTALAALQRHCDARGARFTLITQNVDGLHQQAGSRDVVELHGSLRTWRCAGCGESREERGPAFDDYPPRCCGCGAPRRPGVVWFGELLPEQALRRAIAAAETCELFLSLGTSSLVQPAASLTQIALEQGAFTVEVNPDETPASGLVDLALRGRTGELLPRLIDAALGPPPPRGSPSRR
jgi:NAD-dependent deacetylase